MLTQGWRDYVDGGFWASVVAGVLYTLITAWILFTVGAVVTGAARGGAGSALRLADALLILLACLYLGSVFGLLVAYLGRLLGIHPVGAARRLGFDRVALLFLWAVVMVSVGFGYPESLTPSWLPLVLGLVGLATLVALLATLVTSEHGRWRKTRDVAGFVLACMAVFWAGIFLGVVLLRITATG